MAKVVKSFDFDQRGVKRYPWRHWTDGQTWRITEGEDFVCGVASMRMMLHQKARSTGMRVQTSVQREDGQTRIYFRFWTP